jgi:glycosyltransferase involved in cell wall biosynthesis
VLNKPKVAIACDWLVGIGGAERVVLELHRLYPDAPIYTSQYDSGAIDWFNSADVRTGWLQKLPKSLRKFMPVLRAIWFSRLDLSDYDLVVSSSGAEAKFIKARMHVAYIHAPTHYYWSRYEQYLREPGFGWIDWLARFALRILVGPMRRWDYRAAQRPDFLIANSSHTAKEIKKYYGRDATVIHPPVDIERFKPFAADTKNRHGYVITGRQTPYKRIDLAVEACTQLNVPLTVIGTGPEHKKIKKIAGETINFVGHVSDEDVAKYVGSSCGFIFPNVDDFGIAPVEALAAGTPVVAFHGGGALDYIQEGVNGRFFTPQTAAALARTLQQFESDKYTPDDIKSSAAPFSIQNFHKNIRRFISKL